MTHTLPVPGKLSDKIVCQVDAIGDAYEELCRDVGWVCDPECALLARINQLAVIANRAFFSDEEKMDVEYALHMYVSCVKGQVEKTAVGLNTTQSDICDVMSYHCIALSSETMSSVSG
jgi:uncharacterized protein YnzC (UPF0291/DUF896 family)